MPARIEARLPSYPTLFIGRDDEISAIAARLSDPQCRLLTLVGPGGMGKTRLAVEVAKYFAQTQTPADGAYFVDLQPVNSSDLLVNAIANTLGVLLSGSQDPREQLLNYLSERDGILLLDNFEQLLGSVDLLSDLIKIAPNIKLLVTSREALHIQEEWIWRVGGLSIPASGVPINSFSAVQLFAERTHRTQQDFTLTGQETHIARICQLVDGMPLALELAAGWTRALSCAEIADEIQRGLDFLTTNMRNTPERHQSMQAVFDHSWHLLTDNERSVFPKLSVFRGGFRREAAEQVAGASLRVLAGLVDKSFLRLNSSGRYAVHELMRQYGEEHLNAVTGAKIDTQHRHCAYYAGFMHQRQAALRGARQAVALDEIGHELDNVRVCWEWAVRHDMREEIHQSMHSLFLFCHIRAQGIEGERLFDLAVNRFEQKDSATLAYLLLARTNLATFNGRIVGVDQLPRAISLLDGFLSEDEIALLLWTYAYVREELIAMQIFDDQQYEQVCRNLLERFRIHNQPWGAAYMLYCLGVIFQSIKGQPAEAQSYYRQSLDGFRQIGDRWATAWSVMGLARVSKSSQHYREALQLWQEHWDICAEVGDQGGVVNALAQKARISLRLQDHHAAKFYIAQGIQSHLESGSPFLQRNHVFRSLIELLLSENRHEQAAELSSFQHQQADKAHAQKVIHETDQKLASLTQLLPPDIYQKAVERGKTLNWRAVLKQLEAELGDYIPASVQTVAPLSPAQPLTDPLTERELEVLRLLAAGRSNREIAHDLVLALGTVKWYISEIYSKLGVASRTQAIVRAGELNLLS